MNDQIRQMTKEAREVITGLYNACDSMDEHDVGTRKWLPDKSTREIQELSFYTFFLYIASSDGEITQEEADVINELLGGHYSLADFKLLADKMKVQEEDNALHEVPLVIRAAVECDNMARLNARISGPVYQSYVMLGFLCMLSDLHIRQSEYDRTLKYLRMIYTYLEENLDSTEGIVDPARQLQDLVAKLSDAGGGTEKAVIEPDKPAASQKEEKKPDKKEEKEEKTLEELLAELNSLIGLSEVKYDVISLINLVRIREIREKMGLQMPPISLHLVFSGNPGTGKTTVARLLAGIYHKIGILSKGQLVEVDRSGLVAGYVGQTALKVQDVLTQAKGGVLFIDEAYALTPEHASNDYGLEAIDTLVKGMEDMRDDLIVIVAGYTAPMERFITANPGLKSRFNKFIEFPDYTAEELTQIFKRFCVQNKYRASRPALKFVSEHFQNRIENKPENFANAREARNLFEFAVARQANRVIIESNPTEDMITLLKLEDVAGQSVNIGKQQYLAENAIAGLGGKRDGIPNELLPMKLDELELTPKCWHALQKAQLLTVGQVLDYFDEGKALTTIENLSDKNEQEIREGLKTLGWEK